MKKLFFLFALFGLFATSCEESNIQEPNDDNPIENPDDDNEEKPVFTVESADTILIEADGGEFDVLVTTNLEYSVVIDKESQSWVSVADTRAVRNEKLTFTIAPNEEPEERSATIRLTDKNGNTILSFVIVQEAFEGIFEDNAKDKYTISADGGTVEVAVTTNLEYNVVIDKESQSWVSVADTRAVRKEKLTFTIAPNDEPEERSATIRLTDKNGNTLQSFVIVQEAIEGIFEDNAKDKYTISADGGTVEVAVTTNLEYNVVIDKESQSWVSVADTRAVRKEKLTFTIAPNEQYVSRVATISLIDKDKTTLETFTIEQHPASCASNELLYTSTDGQPIYVDVSAIGVVMTENIYENGVGVMRFNGIITTIPNQLFYNCKNLKTIILPESIAKIGSKAFYDCDSLTSVTIPDSVTTIGDDAFRTCNSLTSVTIPNSVTTIGGGAFRDCDSLTSVTIGNSVTTIGGSAFRDCDSLTSVTIGDSVKTIGYAAFYECYSLTSVTIPNSVTTIGDWAFGYCDSLKKVYCKPTTPPTGGNRMFDSNAAGRKIYVPASDDDSIINAYKKASGWSEYKDYIFDDESKPANDEIWYTNGSTTEPTAPYKPKNFGNATIQSNTYDAEKECWVITFDKNVTKIGNEAFSWCVSLTSVTIPDSVTTIGEEAFKGCDSLKEFKGKFAADNGRCLIMDDTLIAYAEASGTTYTIPDSVTTIGEKAFSCCESLTSVTIPDSVTTIRYAAFAYCESLTSVTIPDSVTTIGIYAFEYCKSLTSVTIGDSVTTIGGHAFWCCDSLTSVTIGDSVTTIGGRAFECCRSLTSVTIGNSVTTIEFQAFAVCTSLTSVTIPDSVTTIGEQAFARCNSLKEFKGKFAADGGRCLIVDGVLNAFAIGCGVTQYTIPDSVTTIGYGAFHSCDSLTSVTIPDSVKTIGNYAFHNCNSLTSVTIGNSVTTIGDYAFSSCDSLTSVTIPNSVTTIGDYAFLSCDSLTSVTIPDSVTTIGKNAFSSCSSLTSVTIPNSVTTIGDSAFYACSKLTSVTIPDSVTTIGYGAFSYCHSLKTVYCKPTTPPTGGGNMFYNNASGRKIYVPASDNDSIINAYKAKEYWSSYADYIFEEE